MPLRELLAQPETLVGAGQKGRHLAKDAFDRQQLASTVQRILEKSSR
jgi:hypothetical protein